MKYKLPKSIKDFCVNIDQSAHERWDEIPISVMVLGPNTGSKRISAQLRKHIINKCNDYGILVRTEHEDFIEVHRKLLGSGRNLCGLEYNAAKHVGAIVVIPDSPGSLVELGMFSFLEKVCEKTLILFSDKYLSPDAQLNFVFLGPKLAYEERNARIEFVDYKSKDLAWERVKDFLHGRRALKWERSVLEDLL